MRGHEKVAFVCADGKKRKHFETGTMIEGLNTEWTPGGVHGWTKSQIELIRISDHIACMQIVSNVPPYKASVFRGCI